MDTTALKKFAQEARRQLMAQVSSKLANVLTDSGAARREFPDAVKQLESEIQRASQDQVVERVAYIWFNRFSALRFMDANGYTGVRVVSPAEGQTRPEILAEAVAGVIDEEFHASVRDRVRGLLDGQISSTNPQAEAYALLLVAACNKWHKTMPFLFEKIADYSELLMPDDLLSVDSVLTKMKATMTEEACQDVEIIGWLYQFYISEKKDQVFAGLKKNVKITAENIPAATQLFTPHWIVRYLVENTLGRLWMLNKPGSSLRTRMDYYIVPEESDIDFLRVDKPENIKLCDPACGSGHMLTYAFDLLYAIYEEEGYDPATIPDLILTHNLYGVEIDDRAGALAGFALVMKAAGRRRRFLRSPTQPNICVMQDVSFTGEELADYAAAVGQDMFTSDLHETLGQFAHAKNFGALIVPKLRDVAEVARRVEVQDFESNLFLRDVHGRVLQVLRMAEALSPKYHVVAANPPYMGAGGMNATLKAWLELNFTDSKHDLMTSFMERTFALLVQYGQVGMINIPSWMFLSSFEDLRKKLILSFKVTSLLHLGRGLFGPDFGTVAFCFENALPTKDSLGVYRRLFDAHVQVRTPEKIESLFKDQGYNRFTVNQSEFLKIPGKPFAYWPTKNARAAFEKGTPLDEICSIGKGFDTGDNERFLKLWHEVGSGVSRWKPCQKGGPFRKWYGNNDFVADWQGNGATLRAFPKSNLRNAHNYFKRGISWTRVSSGSTAFRFFAEGQLFESTGPCLFSEKRDLNSIAAFLNGKVTLEFLKVLAPMMDFQSGHISNLPMVESESIAGASSEIGSKAIGLTKSDWDSFETSWDFSTLPLLDPSHRQASLAATYVHLRSHWQRMINQMQALEEQNNRIFIDAYGLAEELTPDVPLEEITLTCNPAYRYGGKKTAGELDALLLADTIAEFLSYAVGCMFGRYSLDAPGLILANQGEGLAEYGAQVPASSFAPDPDNVIPILDGDWFADDITERFRKFLRVTFGEANFQENLAFIESSLGKDIRKYFTRDFFNDHLKRYRKRPIYWLFSSPKGTFQALIYMHRYTSDTVNVVLNEYVRPFRQKLDAYRSDLEKTTNNPELSTAHQAKAQKDILLVSAQIEELDKWERDIIFPLATQKIAIDLDEGVKANYPKFGSALKTIKGLEAADE